MFGWKKEKTQQEIELEKLREEAKKQALQDLKPELVKMYKEQELEKMKKKSKSWGDVLAKEFSDAGNTIFAKDKMDSVIKSNTENQGNMFSDNKIDRMLERGSNRKGNNNTKNGEIFTNDKIDRMLGKNNTNKKKNKKDYMDI